MTIRTSCQKNNKGLNNRTKNNILIVFEGINGAGKSTQMKLYADYLSKEYHELEVTMIEEPNKNLYIGEFVRDYITDRDKLESMDDKVLFYLFQAAQFEGQRYIEKKLADHNSVVLCTRNYLSSVAYRKNLDVSWMLNQFYFNEFLLRPNLCIYIDVSVETAIKRLSKRDKKPAIWENKEYLSEVLQRYHNILEYNKKNRGENIVVVESKEDDSAEKTHLRMPNFRDILQCKFMHDLSKAGKKMLSFLPAKNCIDRVKIKEKEKIIKYESEEAAKFKNIEMWVSRKGFVFSTEEDARINGCTHFRCPGCNQYTKKVNAFIEKCPDCKEKYRHKYYLTFEKKDWDGDSIVYSEKIGEYFFTLDSFLENEAVFIPNNKNKTTNELLTEYRVTHCKPAGPVAIDVENLFENVLIEDYELPEKMYEIEETFNKEAKEVNYAFYPTNIRVFLDDKRGKEKPLRTSHFI
jgi:dTMP kinase